MQPKPATTGSLCSWRQNFSAPRRAREYSMCTEPRSRATSAVAVGTLDAGQRSVVLSLKSILLVVKFAELASRDAASLECGKRGFTH